MKDIYGNFSLQKEFQWLISGIFMIHVQIASFILINSHNIRLELLQIFFRNICIAQNINHLLQYSFFNGYLTKIWMKHSMNKK